VLGEFSLFIVRVDVQLPISVLRISNQHSMVSVVDKPTNPVGVSLESWSEGFMVGSLIMMTLVTIANMKKHVLLHKLILLEVSHPSLIAINTSQNTN